MGKILPCQNVTTNSEQASDLALQVDKGKNTPSRVRNGTAKTDMSNHCHGSSDSADCKSLTDTSVEQNISKDRQRRFIGAFSGTSRVMESVSELINSVSLNLEGFFEGISHTLRNLNLLIEGTKNLVDETNPQVDTLFDNSKLLIGEAVEALSVVGSDSQDMFDRTDNLIANINNGSQQLVFGFQNLVDALKNNSGNVTSGLNEMTGSAVKFIINSQENLQKLHYELVNLTDRADTALFNVDKKLVELLNQTGREIRELSRQANLTFTESSGLVSDELISLSVLIKEILSNLGDSTAEGVGDLIKELRQIIILAKVATFTLCILMPIVTISCISLSCYRTCKSKDRSPELRQECKHLTNDQYKNRKVRQNREVRKDMESQILCYQDKSADDQPTGVCCEALNAETYV